MKYGICIFHGNCADGFTAAWVVRKKMGDEGFDFVAGVYGQPPPDVTGRDVIIVDFSYPRPVMEQIARDARSLLVLDHHKSAKEALAGFQEQFEDTPFMDVTVVFDMERSGAGIAWDFFFPGQPRPRLVDRVEDRDLWRFKYPDTREIQAAIFSYPYTFENWDMLEEHAELFTERLETEGRAIERKHHKDITELCAVVTRTMEIGGHAVPVANLPYTLSSDAGHLLADGHPFAACYWDTQDGRVFSLRSRPGGADVSIIAMGYGGGGHANAAGFRVPYDHPLVIDIAHAEARVEHDRSIFNGFEGQVPRRPVALYPWYFMDSDNRNNSTLKRVDEDGTVTDVGEVPPEIRDVLGAFRAEDSGADAEAIIEVGDQVQFKSGGPSMMVDRIDDRVLCLYFDEGSLQRQLFNPAHLQIVTKAKTQAGAGTNYVADREVNPTQIKFVNGRRVWINAEGGLDTDFGPLTQ